MLEYIKFSIRILSKNRLYTFINIFGLAVGISCCILISLFVTHELNYDNFHPDKERIYRLTTVGNGFTTGLTSFGIGPTLKKDYEEIEDYCRYLYVNELVDVKYKNKQFNEPKIMLADSSFFHFFGFKLLEGDANKVLSKPQSIVISQNLAYKYFGEENPLNDSIYINNRAYRVTGIVEDDPNNSDVQYNAIASMNSMRQNRREYYYKDWFRVICFTYIKLKDASNYSGLQEKLDAFSENYVRPWGIANDTKQVDFYRAKPIKEVHFDNSNEFDSPKGNFSYVYIFSSIAIFVLLIACINYINLSLSQATSRAKEIGIRKTLGSDHTDIKIQYYTETFIIAFVALFIGLIFVEIFIPTFNKLTLKSFEFSSLWNIQTVLYTLFFLLVLSFLSGSYPASILSSYHPIEVLKGQKGKRSTTGVARKVLITLQFIFSISMMISSIVVFQQMGFMKNKDLGFSKEQIMVFTIPSDTSLNKRLPSIQEKINAHPLVVSSSFSSSVPGKEFGDMMFRVERDFAMRDAQLKLVSCDESYLDLLDISILEGRNFTDDETKDGKKKFIINKIAEEELGWENNAIGKRIQWGLLPEGKARHDGVVIGVVENFHSHSLHSEISPMAIQYVENRNYLSVKIKDVKNQEGRDALMALWQKEIGNRIIESFFLDENFNLQYHFEERMLKVFNYFTFISIILSALGLFALTSFIIKQKTKEIGIRKILGASINHIIYLISVEFLVLMVVAFVIAGFPTFYFINQWLNTFPYHIELGSFPFVISGVITFFIIILVIIYNTIITGNFNPIDALKSE